MKKNFCLDIKERTTSIVAYILKEPTVCAAKFIRIPDEFQFKKIQYQFLQSQDFERILKADLNVSNDQILIEDVMDAHSTIQDYMNRNHAIKKTTKTFLVS